MPELLFKLTLLFTINQSYFQQLTERANEEKSSVEQVLVQDIQKKLLPDKKDNDQLLLGLVVQKDDNSNSSH